MRNFIVQTVRLLLIALTAQSLAAAPQTKNDDLVLSQPLAVAWRFQSDQTTNFTPAADESTVFVPLTSGAIKALTAKDGKLVWRTEVGGEFSASPAVDDRCIYAATRYEEPDHKIVHGTLRALSKSTGVTLWMRTLPTALSGGLIVGEKAVFGASVDGRVYAFDKHTGLTLWINEYGEEFSAQPVLAGGRVYFGSNAGTMRALDVNSGKLIWQYKTNGAIHNAIAVANNTAYFGSGDGNVYAFSETKSKILWHRRTGAAVEAVSLVDNGVLVSSLDNFAYLLSSNKGALVWRRQLPGRISSRPITAADGALFTPFSTDSAIVLNLRDGKTANTLPLGDENSSSAAPIVIKNYVVITTPRGLIAFAAPR